MGETTKGSLGLKPDVEKCGVRSGLGLLYDRRRFTFDEDVPLSRFLEQMNVLLRERE
jgi:hypothetical protein